MKKNLCLALCLILLAGLFPVSAMAADIPNPEVIYDASNDWVGTLVIDESKTVGIKGIVHINQGSSTDGSAIRICGGATVSLVFEGDTILEGNSSKDSAGIEVEEGSTVNIYGREGSTLTVTGGKNGAGIGGIGYSGVSATNPKAGNVHIWSGTITAIGGAKGAGIGSGYHSSAGVIHIHGGNITALGSSDGAGIGSGYGTSGGANIAAGVGFYNGGEITISGGTVRAAAYHLNFDNVDQYNLESLYGEGYADTFSAGIGGGYGASSGTIVIEGDADVIAVGSCGGSGIGTGRGTSKTENYNASTTPVDITIRGNAKVVALATEDRRTSITGHGVGAAIGTGFGVSLEDGSAPTGSVRILGNANVYASTYKEANAIGTGFYVTKRVKLEDGTIGPLPMKGPANGLDVLEIGPDCTIVAVSEGTRTAIDETKLPLAGMAVVDNNLIRDSGSAPDDLKTGNVQFSAGTVSDGETVDVKIPVTAAEPRQFAVQLPGNTGALFFADDTRVLLSSEGDPSWQFPAGKTQEIIDVNPIDYYAVKKVVEYTQGSGADAVFTFKRIVNDSATWPNYTGSAIDGSELPGGSHKATKGSLVLTLKSKYLDTLAAGSHKVKVSFTDGSADAALNIKAPDPVPKTGDKANPLLWLGVIILGLTGIGEYAAKRRGKQARGADSRRPESAKAGKD